MNSSYDLRNCKLYFAGLLVLLLSGTYMLLTNGKAASFINLNIYHPFSLNIFFIKYTFVGDGIFALCIIALLFLYKRTYEGIILMSSFLISGLAVQVIKNLVTSPRPRLFFESGRYLHFIDGVSLANNSSFPSGHTATAFATATVLVLIMKNKNWQLLILVAAALAGYSRIYLAQHFLIDVIIGIIIGSVSGIISVYLVPHIKIFSPSFSKMRSGKTHNTQTSPSSIQPAA